MRSAKLPVYLLLLPWLSIAMLNCSSLVPATITRVSPVPLIRDPEVFLIASRDHERIAKSVEMAGLRLSTDARIDSVLEVRVGGSRSTSSCGSVHNVSYTLSTNAVRRLIEIKGRGATGSCNPNIFDRMSQKLVAQMGGG